MLQNANPFGVLALAIVALVAIVVTAPFRAIYFVARAASRWVLGR